MRSEFFKASLARLFAVGVGFATGLINLKLYGHFLTPDTYGVIVVALQLISFLPMLDGGFRMATNRRLLASVDGHEKADLIIFSQTIYSWLLLLGFLIGVALMIGYGLLPHESAGGSQPWTFSLFLAMGAFGALSMFAGAQSGLLLGLGAQAKMAFVGGLGSLMGMAALAGALWMGLGTWAFPLSLLASALTSYGSSVALFPWQEWKIPLFRFSVDEKFRARFAQIRPDAWKAFRSQISIALVFSSDLILASFFCQPVEVAIYGVLSRVLSIARGFLQVFNEAAWPFVAARAQGLERFQDWIVRANSWIHGLAGGGMAVLLPWFIGWYMGPEWKPPGALSWLFILRFLVIGISNPASYFLLGKGDFSNVAKCTEREIYLSVALGVILGPMLGLTGIAIAYLVGTAGGSLYPFWAIYARERAQKLAPLLVSAWLRLVLGFGAGWILGKILLYRLLPLLPS